MDSTTAMYVAQGLHGLSYGMLLFLVASCLTIIFGIMGILNLAHASFFMISAYLCHSILTMTGHFWLALLVAPLFTAMLGVLTERFLLRKVHAFGHIGELLITVGISLVILEGVKAIWGTEPYLVAVPEFLSGFLMIAFNNANYTLFAAFLTSMLVFGQQLVQADASEAGWERLLATLVGALIAITVTAIGAELKRRHVASGATGSGRERP